MSRRKHRNTDETMDMLAVAAGHGLRCHCEGGMAMSDRKLQRLVRDGLVRFVRRPRGYGGHGFNTSYTINTTYAVATDRGRVTLREAGGVPSTVVYYDRREKTIGGRVLPSLGRYRVLKPIPPEDLP